MASALHRIYDDIGEGLQQIGESSPRIPDMVLVDSGWRPDVVFSVCRQRGGIPILGRGKSQRQPTTYLSPKSKNAEVRLIGDGWHISRVRDRHYPQLTLDSDRGKMDFQAGIRVKPGNPGSIQLPAGVSQTEIRRLCEHFASEVFRQEIMPGGEIKEVWNKSGSNHYLDCGCYAITGIRCLLNGGVKYGGGGGGSKPKQKRTLAEAAGAANGR